MRQEKKIYRGVNAIVLDNSEIAVDTKMSPFRIDNFLSRVQVTKPTQRNGRMNIDYDSQTGTLRLENTTAGVYVPFGRSTDIHAQNNSAVRGRFFSGHLQDDSTSSMNLEVPYSFPRRMGPVGTTIAGVAGDLGYIAATAVPIAIFGIPLVRFFGGCPVNAIDDFLYLSAGINVGFRGDSKRALFTSLAVAVGSILGPEIMEGVKNGVDAGMGQVGLLEDGGKALTYTLVWGVGKGLRDYYHEKTKKF